MSDRLIHKGRLIELHNEQVALREGGSTHFDIVKHPGGAVIAALNDQGEICLLRQWRHAIQAHIWELPAGCLEQGESPLSTAKRELEEEAGVTAAHWTDLGELITSPGFSNERLYLFAAKGLSKGTIKLDDAEQLETHWLPLSEVVAMALQGKIDDAKTLAVLFRLKLQDQAC